MRLEKIYLHIMFFGRGGNKLQNYNTENLSLVRLHKQYRNNLKHSIQAVKCIAYIPDRENTCIHVCNRMHHADTQMCVCKADHTVIN